MPLFLLNNWKWIVPAAGMAVLGVWIVILKLEVAGLEAEVAGMEAAKQREIAEARRLLLEAHAQDKALNQAIADAYRKQSLKLSEELQNAQARLAATGSTTTCVNSGAGRAFTDGLRSTGSSQAVPR